MVSPTDVLIVAATKVESKAVLDAFAELTGQPARIVTANRRTYRDLGAVGGTRVFLALTEMGSGGLGASQQAVQKGIAALHPGAVLLVGIAFGVDQKKQHIGDILVSQQLQLYDLQRVGKDQIVLRGDKPHASPRLIDYFRHADLDWDESKAKIEFGLILSGEKLVDNLDYREQLQRLAPEALGGEMEGAGLYVACQDAKVDWIVVKAICDWADGHKAEDKDARQRWRRARAARRWVGTCRAAFTFMSGPFGYVCADPAPFLYVCSVEIYLLSAKIYPQIQIPVDFILCSDHDGLRIPHLYQLPTHGL